MGRPAKLLELACIGCGARDQLAARSAELRGWVLWLGGGRCPACVGAVSGAAPASLASPAPAPSPSLASTAEATGQALGLLPTLVRCSACSRTFERGMRYADGWRPGPHWSPTPEQVAAYHERRARLPLCTGWDRPGEVVPIPGAGA